MSKKKSPSQDMVSLSSGILVSRAFHDGLFEHVMVCIPDRNYGMAYKAKEFVAPEYYRSLDPWYTGCCVADWERNRLVPLRFLGCPYCSVRYYERT